MATNTFSSPDPVEIIPASRIAPLIAATERELEVLERTAVDAIAAADDAEAWERAATNEGSSSTWALIRVHREQCDEARRDAQVMVDLATRHAQYLVAEARAEADEIVNGAHRAPADVPTPRPVPADTTTPAPTASDNATARASDNGSSMSSDGGSSNNAGSNSGSSNNGSSNNGSSNNGSSNGGHGAETSATRLQASTPTAVLTQARPAIRTVTVAQAPVVAEAPAVAETPTVQVPVVTEQPLPTIVVPAPVAPAPAVIAPATVVQPPAEAPSAYVAPSAYAELAPEALVVEAPPAPAPSQPADGGFWPAETRARRRLALPISAVLEASAVLLILVFILLRLQ